MSEQEYSDFTLNFNPGARGNDKAPTLKGKAKVIDSDGTITAYEVAAWGPNKAQSGGPDFYDVSFTPKDPALAARQLKAELGPVRNAVEGFELTKVGYGKIFERTDEEIAKAKADGKSLPKFYGHVLVQSRSGELVVTDLAAWHRAQHNFYSGNANLHDPKAAAAARAAKPAARPG